MGEVNFKILISVKIFCPELPKKVCGINVIRNIRFCFSPYPYYQMGSEGFIENVWLQNTYIICMSIALTQAMVQNFLNYYVLWIVWFCYSPYCVILFNSSYCQIYFINKLKTTNIDHNPLMNVSRIYISYPPKIFLYLSKYLPSLRYLAHCQNKHQIS